MSNPETEQVDQLLDDAFTEPDTDPEPEVDEYALESRAESTEPEVEVDQPTEDVESFTGLDPSKLPDELQPIYKSMQADYTRKTQSIAERDKAYEYIDQFGGPEVATQAIDLLYRLESDPQFALQFHQSLSTQLEAQGYTPAQAQYEAAQQIGRMVEGEDEDFEDDLYESEYAQVNPELEQKINQISAWAERIEQERLETQIANDLSRQEMMIREQHPEYKEEDFDALYLLGHSTNGNLVQAAEVYDQIQNRFLQAYINQKGTAAVPSEPSVGGGGAEPKQFDSINDPKVDELVDEMLRRAMAQ